MLRKIKFLNLTVKLTNFIDPKISLNNLEKGKIVGRLHIFYILKIHEILVRFLCYLGLKIL